MSVLHECLPGESAYSPAEPIEAGQENAGEMPCSAALQQHRSLGAIERVGADGLGEHRGGLARWALPTIPGC